MISETISGRRVYWTDWNVSYLQVLDRANATELNSQKFPQSGLGSSRLYSVAVIPQECHRGLFSTVIFSLIRPTSHIRRIALTGAHVSAGLIFSLNLQCIRRVKPGEATATSCACRRTLTGRVASALTSFNQPVNAR